MLCDRVLDNLDSPTAAALLAGRTVDYLDVTWAELHRRSIRSETRGGAAVGILLPLGIRLRHGDVLHVDAERLIAVHHVLSEVLVGRPPTARQTGLVACELGNLHLPVEITDDEIVTLPDGPAYAAFRTHEVPCRIETRRFAPLRASVLNNVRLASTFEIARP
jgi:urease accessory protein UreE